MNKEFTLNNRRNQFSVIEGISRDFTDIMLIDFASNRAHMMKINGTMIDYDAAIRDRGNDYMPTWEKYCNKYVLAEEREAMLEAVKPEMVLENIASGEDYLYSYRILLGNDIFHYQVKFININEANDREELVVAAIRNIDKILEEQKRHDFLVEKASRDMLTGLANRNAFEEDIDANPGVPASDDFVYVALDLNGLKNANDNYGHEAGDELLKGVAACMRRCMGPYGKLYRTGGDEFAALIYANKAELENIRNDFERTVMQWSGKLNESLTVSCGYVSKYELPECTVRELGAEADQRMYQAKNEYYQSHGIDRRGTQNAYEALCDSYTKILKVNLKKDAFAVIKNDDNETEFSVALDAAINSESVKAVGICSKGGTFSEWIRTFAKSGIICEDDVSKFLAATELTVLREHFETSHDYIHLHYRKKSSDGFKPFMMEIMKAKDYTPDNQYVYLFVKRVD